jgi:hypothetical protein
LVYVGRYVVLSWYIDQAKIITVLTTETREMSTDRNETDLRQAGRMACDSGGYLCKLASNGNKQDVENQLLGLKKFFEPQGVVGNLMINTVSMSDIDHQPVVTLFRRVAHQGPL